MAKDKLSDYDSTTASNNTDVGGISVAEGMLPSAVNNSIRELTKQLGAFADGTDGIDVLSLADDDASHAIKLQAPSAVTADTTFTLPDGDGVSGQTMITDGAGALSWAAPYGNRSLIINGSMQVAARGTSSTGVTTATYLVDRFQGRTTSGSIDLSQSTTAPAGFSNSFKLAVNTTNAFGTASDEAYFEQIVEAQNLQHLQYGLSTAQKITLSFWVRSSVAGTYGIWFYQDDATKDYEVSYTIDSADTWEKKSVTVDGNTADVINNDNGSGMRVRWYLDGGSDRRGTISSNWATSTSTSTRLPTGAPAWMNGSNDFYLTGVQLEVGDTATPFEHRSYGDELRRCQRYYYNTYITPQSSGSGSNGLQAGTFNANDRYNVDNFFPVEMRSQPTVVYYGGRSGNSNTADRVSRYNSDTLRSFVNEPNVTIKGIRGYFDTDSNDFAIKYHFTADAEL